MPELGQLPCWALLKAGGGQGESWRQEVGGKGFPRRAGHSLSKDWEAGLGLLMLGRGVRQRKGEK